MTIHTPESNSALRDGDLVLHVPANGRRGSGPFYLDRASAYGGDETQAAVSCLVSGPLGWTFGRPKIELVAVGRAEVERSDRRGNSFSLDALRRIAPAIKAAREEFYQRYPNFENGRASVPIREVKWPMQGFIHNDIMGSVAKSYRDEIPVVTENLTAYATPQPGHEVQVERTALSGPGGAAVMLAIGIEAEDGNIPRGYFAIPEIHI